MASVVTDPWAHGYEGSLRDSARSLDRCTRPWPDMSGSHLRFIGGSSSIDRVCHPQPHHGETRPSLGYGQLPQGMLNRGPNGAAGRSAAFRPRIVIVDDPPSTLAGAAKAATARARPMHSGPRPRIYTTAMPALNCARRLPPARRREAQHQRGAHGVRGPVAISPEGIARARHIAVGRRLPTYRPGFALSFAT